MKATIMARFKIEWLSIAMHDIAIIKIWPYQRVNAQHKGLYLGRYLCSIAHYRASIYAAQIA